MTTYIIRRLLLFIPVLFGISLFVFMLLHLVPGDPATALLGNEASPEQVAALKKAMGLDEPLPAQYLRFISRVAQGDLGRSIMQKQPVTTLIASSLPATVELALSALLLSLVIGIPLGILAAVKHNTVLDYGSTVVALVGISMPVFWTGVLLILLFALNLGWLPAFGRGAPILDSLLAGRVDDLLDGLKHLLMPAFTLALALSGLTARLTRSSMLEVLRQEYMQTARAKGLRERLVILRHGLKNALLPVVTVIGLQVGGLLSGAVVIETIFAWPGVGRLAVIAINQRDYPVVQGSVLFVALIFSVTNLLVDLSYAYLNPRIRYH